MLLNGQSQTLDHAYRQPTIIKFSSIKAMEGKSLRSILSLSFIEAFHLASETLMNTKGAMNILDHIGCDAIGQVTANCECVKSAYDSNCVFKNTQRVPRYSLPQRHS